MSTEKVDGFRLDRIGQFLSTSYPELRLTPGLDALLLRPFAPGVLLHSDGRHHHAGTPAPGGSAWGALHAVRALASAPRQGAVRKGPLWGGPVTRGRGGASWAAAAAGGGAALKDRTGEADGVVPDRTTARGSLRGRASSPWGGLALRDRGTPALRARTDASSWGGPTVNEQAVITRSSPAVPRSRSGAPLGGPVDQARLGTALSRLAATPVERLLARPESAAGQALAARGVPARTIDGFLRPLLAALLCDPELTTSSRCADLALRAFAGGLLCAGGRRGDAARGARRRAAAGHRTHRRARDGRGDDVGDHGRARRDPVPGGARRDGRARGGRTPARPACTRLPPGDGGPPHDRRPARDRRRAPPGLRPGRPGRPHGDRQRSRPEPRTRGARPRLLNRPRPSPPDVETAVRTHLSRLYGTSTTRWETLAVHHTPTAVPVMRPPHDLRRPVRLLAYLYVCGDHRDTSTVQGALHSGHRASTAILKDLGAAGSMHAAERMHTTQAA